MTLMSQDSDSVHHCHLYARLDLMTLLREEPNSHSQKTHLSEAVLTAIKMQIRHISSHTGKQYHFNVYSSLKSYTFFQL